MKNLSLIFLLLLSVSTLFAFTDKDNDGMMDSWESRYGISSPTADPDSDGLTNLQEFVRQSDPKVKDNNLSYKKIDSIHLYCPSGYTSGRNYILNYGDYIIKSCPDGGDVGIYDKNYNYVSSTTNAGVLFYFDLGGIIEKYAKVQKNYMILNNKDASPAGSAVSIIDLKDIKHPKLASKLSFAPYSSNAIGSIVNQFDVKDNYLYLLQTKYKIAENNETDEYGNSYGSWYYLSDKIKQVLAIYNISDLKNPILISETQIDNDGVSYDGILVDNNIAYITGSSYLKIIDFSNSANPKIEKKIKVANEATYGTISKIEDYLYIGLKDKVKIYSIKNPLNPIYKKTINLDNIKKLENIDIKTNLAYLKGSNRLLDIYDVSDPLNPVKIQSFKNKYEYISAKKDLLLYPTDNYGANFDVYKLRNFSIPNNKPIVSIPFSSFSDINDSKLVLFDYNGDATKTNKYLEIYEFNQTNKTVTLSKYYIDGTLIKQKSGKFKLLYGGTAIGIDVDNDYFVLYSADGKMAKSYNGKQTYVDGETTSDSIKDILKRHSKIYFFVSELKKQYLDNELGNTKYDFSKDGKYLYLTSPDGIYIYNINNVSLPKNVGYFAKNNYGKIKVIGDTLYHYAYGNENDIEGYYIYKYDITNPTNPKYLGLETEKDIDFSKPTYKDDDMPFNCKLTIKIPNKDNIICFEQVGDVYHYDMKFYDLKAYDKDFDGIPDRYDLYPNDKSKFFLDSNNNGKIDKVNPNTNPSSVVYSGYKFDNTIFHLETDAAKADEVNLFLSNGDENYSIENFFIKSLFDQTNSYESYLLGFDNYDSYLITQLYNINFNNGSDIISSNSKENNPQNLSVGKAYEDKLLSNNSGVDKRYVSFFVGETGDYSIIIMKKSGLSSLMKIDNSKDSKITAKIYEATDDGNRTLLGQKVLNPNRFSSIKMPLEKEKTYFLSFDLQNIKQFKYNIIIVKNYETYFQNIKLDSNGEASYTFIAPESTTYQFVINANRKVKSKLYLGTQADNSHLLKSFENNYINEAIGLRASSYTIVLKGAPNEKVTFVLGESDKRKEIEPNNTYQSATSIDKSSDYYSENSKVYQSTLTPNDVDFYKIKTGDGWDSSSTFSVTITPNIKISDEDITKYQFNLFVYNSSGDIVEKSYEYLEGDSITYNFNVGSGGIYFLRFSSNYPKSFEYNISTSGTSTPPQTQSEIAYKQKYSDYILGRGLNLEASTEDKSDSGELIILVGDSYDKNDNLYMGSQELSKNMYDRFLLRGFSDKDIYYMNGTNDDIDIDNDGITDNVIDDKNPTSKDFYKAIRDSANSGKKGPLFIYMVDHGANGSFKVKDGDIITAAKLKEAIDDFINKSHRKVVVIIEACKSGSFIPTLTENGTRDDILVMTSSKAKQLSYIDKFGNVSFSKFLADAILSGSSLKDAFDASKKRLYDQGGVYTLQIPQISSNASEKLLNFKVGGNFAAAGMELTKIVDYFGKDIDSFDISTLNKNIKLYAKIGGNVGVNRVWATVIPPNYQPPNIADNSFKTPDMTPYTVELKYNKDNNRYEGVYDKLEAAYEGKYSITYYVEDSDGNVISKNVELQGHNIDSTLTELKNKPLFSLSTTFLELLLDTNDSVKINALGDYQYSVKSDNNSIVTVAIKDNKIVVKALDVGEANITVTAVNNGYTTKKELVVKVKESNSVKKEVISYDKGWSLITSKIVDSIKPAKIPNIITSWKYKDGKWLIYAADKNLREKAAKEGLKSMDEIKAGEGGWIFTSNSGKITQIGTPYNILGDDLSSKLTYGWNLIGTGDDLSIKNLYNKIAVYGSDIEAVWAYRKRKWFVYTKDIFYLNSLKENPDIGTLEKLRGGEGFWIYIK